MDEMEKAVQALGFAKVKDQIFRKRIDEATHAILCRLDGWNWGWLIVGRRGAVVEGALNHEWGLPEAASAAEVAIQRRRQEREGNQQ